jgi:hypothetical protein
MTFAARVREWRDIEWLRFGTPRQQAAHEVLCGFGILTVLAPFDPVLAGTIPLGIDTPGSDLDLICEVGDSLAFAHCLIDSFGALDGFRLSRQPLPGDEATIARFSAGGFPIEVFGQNTPVDQQAAVVHLDVEARLLRLGGEALRIAVHRLKMQGIGTEAAFAQELGLCGDPYVVIYQISAWPDDRLADLLGRRVCVGVANRCDLDAGDTN